MVKSKKKARYVSPRVTGTSAMLLNLICTSVRFNIQVNPLENMNDPTDPLKGFGDAADEVFYFES